MIHLLRKLWKDGEGVTPADYAVMLFLLAAALVLGAAAAGVDRAW